MPPPPYILLVRPVTATHAGTVVAPIERVFELVADPTRMPEWFPQCSGVTAAPPPNRKGARHRLHFPRDRHLEIEIVEYAPPTGYGWLETYRRAGSKTFFALQFQGGSTKITMKYLWQPQSLRTWLLGQFSRRRNALRTFDALLQNLRKRLMR